MTETYGCDFAWTKPDGHALFAAGYTFVIGYVSEDMSKDLSGPQIAAYRADGLAVGLVFETTADRVLWGAAGGRSDGEYTESHLRARGYPENVPVFFAVDFDISPAQYAVADAYSEAFNLATNNPVGTYGSYAWIEHRVTPGAQPVQYGWQTAAWSGGLLSQKAHIYQRSYHKYPLVVPGNQFDEDVICKPITLFGGSLSPGGIVAPAPPPPHSVPVYYRVVSGDNLTSIGRHFGVSVGQLVQWNHIADANVIYAGQVLIVGYRTVT